jgi:protein MpaA
VLRGLILAALVATGVAAASSQTVVGHSVKGRAIVAYERGDPSAPVALVVGVIHGNETAGLAVIRRLRTMPLPAGVHLWLVPELNPDGVAAGTRQNAHGVDLNRNWPVAWVHNGRPWDGYYSGPRPMSEPENRAMRAFILRVKPALTIWYHQPLDEVISRAARTSWSSSRPGRSPRRPGSGTPTPSWRSRKGLPSRTRWPHRGGSRS